MLCHISCSSFYVILFIYVIFVCLSRDMCGVPCVCAIFHVFYVLLFIYVIFVCLSRHVCCVRHMFRCHICVFE